MADVVLRARGLMKAFGGQEVLRGVDLDLGRGEVVLLRGENGSGKTTLLNILTGNLEPDAGTIEYRAADGTRQHCRFPQPLWVRLNPFRAFTPEFAARHGVGRSWQDVRLFDSLTARENIAVADPAHPGEGVVDALVGTPRSRRREAAALAGADDALRQLGLAGSTGVDSDTLSLGQTKRVAIARAVAAGTRVLLLDEPLAGLDRPGIRDVLGWLAPLARAEGLTLVVIEHAHSAAAFEDLVTTRWTLDGGRLRIDAAAAGPAAAPVRPHWHRLLSRFAEETGTEPLPRGAVLTRFRIPGRFRDDACLAVDGLVVDRGGRPIVGVEDGGAVPGLRLAVRHGEVAVLQAPNGWGKSTLFEALAGLIPARRGTVRVDGTDLAGLPAWGRPRRGLHLNAAGAAYFADLRLADLSALAGTPAPAGDRLDPDKRLSALSGGELRRVALSTFLGRPNLRVGLLDEPFLALDAAAADGFVGRLSQTPFASLLISEPYS